MLDGCATCTALQAAAMQGRIGSDDQIMTQRFIMKFCTIMCMHSNSLRQKCQGQDWKPLDIMLPAHSLTK